MTTAVRLTRVVFFGFVPDHGSMEQPTDLLSTGQAARLLGCSRQHVVDLCERGVLSFVSVGSHRRVRRAHARALTTNELTRDQERSQWLLRWAAGPLAADPKPRLSQSHTNV